MDYFPIIQFYGEYDSTCSYCGVFDEKTQKLIKNKTGKSKKNKIIRKRYWNVRLRYINTGK